MYPSNQMYNRVEAELTVGCILYCIVFHLVASTLVGTYVGIGTVSTTVYSCQADLSARLSPLLVEKNVLLGTAILHKQICSR